MVMEGDKEAVNSVGINSDLIGEYIILRGHDS
jgi:hypothetical protein